jgi:hypothetical protein
MKPATAQAAELVPASAERSGRDRVSGLELVGFCTLIGLAIVGRARGWPRARRSRF